MRQIAYRRFERLLHQCPTCDGLCARDPGPHPCTQCNNPHQGGKHAHG